MKQINKFWVLLVVLLGVGVGTFGFTNEAEAYEVNKEFMLGPNEGSPIKAIDNYIILHETANPTATGRNEATYMKRNWQNAYTQYIVGDGIVYQVGTPGYVAWGAGSYANANSPVQIELQHSTDPALFAKNYRVYVELIRNSADQFGIPKTLDVGGIGTRGVKSHLWVTQNVWGDHTDPYGYLAKMGVTKTQLANDIANGFGSTPPPVVTPPVTPPVVTPNGLVIKDWNKRQTTDTVLNVRTSPNTNAPIIKTLPQGYNFNATRVVTNGQNIDGYASWFEVDGQGWVSGAYVTEVKAQTPAPKPPVTNGYNIVNWNKPQVTDVNGLQIRTAPTSNSTSIGQLNVGQRFTATRKVQNGQNVNGYTTWFEVNGRGWVSGAYVTETKTVVQAPTLKGQNLPNSGYYKVPTATNIRSGPGTGYAVTGMYNAGEGFYYDSKIVANGYVWLHYISFNGQHRYVAVV